MRELHHSQAIWLAESSRLDIGAAFGLAVEEWETTYALHAGTGKAQKARNAGDAAAMERFWRDDLTHAVASSNPLDRAKALQHLGSDLMN